TTRCLWAVFEVGTDYFRISIWGFRVCLPKSGGRKVKVVPVSQFFHIAGALDNGGHFLHPTPTWRLRGFHHVAVALAVYDCNNFRAWGEATCIGAYEAIDKPWR